MPKNICQVLPAIIEMLKVQRTSALCTCCPKHVNCGCLWGSSLARVQRFTARKELIDLFKVYTIKGNVAIYNLGGILVSLVWSQFQLFVHGITCYIIRGIMRPPKHLWDQGRFLSLCVCVCVFCDKTQPLPPNRFISCKYFMSG